MLIKSRIKRLNDQETRAYLLHALAHTQSLKVQNGMKESAIRELIELHDDLMADQEKVDIWQPSPTCSHVHIVSGDSFAGGMKQALSRLKWTDKHKLIRMPENYAIGPLHQLDQPQGRQARNAWFRDNISDALEWSACEEENAGIAEQFALIPAQAHIVLWTGQNACEQATLRHALYLLRGTDQPISIQDAGAYCEALYNRPDAEITYRYSGEIPTDKLEQAITALELDAKALVSPEARVALTKDWLRLTAETGSLRIWQDGTLREVPVNYYDSYLLSKLDELNQSLKGNSDCFIKSARLIGEAIGYCEQYVSDAYFEYRLREMIYSGLLEIKGIPAAMRFYSVRRKSTPPPDA